MAGIQAQAGVLTIDGEHLTTKAKQRFVQDVIDELSGGSSNLPCGPTLAPVNAPALKDLMDETKFPDFHKNYLGPDSAYEQIAKAMDVKGATPLFPIVDPFHFAVALGYSLPSVKPPIPFILTLPDLISMFPKLDPKITIPELKKKLPMLPKLPVLPPFPPQIDPRFTALIELNLRMIKLAINVFPLLLPKLLTKIPSLSPPKLPDLLFGLACGAMSSSIAADPSFTTQIIAQKVLVNKMVECAGFDAAGLALGCPDPDIAGGPGLGIVGSLGTAKGLGALANEQEVQKEVKKKKDQAVQDEETLRDNARRLISGYVPSGYGKHATDPGGKKFAEMTQNRGELAHISTCGFLCQWLLHRLGCRDPNIMNWDDSQAGLKFKPGENLSRLYYGALKVGAWVNFYPGRTPKTGDCVLIQNSHDVKGGDHASNAGTGPESQTSSQAPSYTSQHVFVFLDDTTDPTSKETFWRSADAGQGMSESQYSDFITRRLIGRRLVGNVSAAEAAAIAASQDPNHKKEEKAGEPPPPLPGRDVVGWVDISKLLNTSISAAADLRGASQY